MGSFLDGQLSIMLRFLRNALIFRRNRVLFTFLLFIFFLFTAKGYGELSFSAEVMKIIDGDSIVVKQGEKYIEIRLYGIDSPEWKQRSSRVSRKHIKNLIFKKEVVVIGQYHDTYGRLVALIKCGGHDINGDLVESGMAWVYPTYCRKTVCRKWSRSQVKAEKDGRGLWSETHPIPPWEWKKLHHR